MRNVKFWTCVLLLFSGNHVTGEEPPEARALQYSRFWQAQYAVYTDLGPGTYDRQRGGYNNRGFMLYRLEYSKTLDHYQPQKSLPSVSVRFDMYDQDSLNMTNIRATELSGRGAFELTRSGNLALLTELWRQGGTPLAAWSPPFIVEMPLLFPAFTPDAASLRPRDRWESETAPFALLGSTFDSILQGKLDVRTLPPTVIHSHWKDWKEVDGRRCAVIDFWFEAKADEKLKQGKEDGQVRYEGTSYFSLELGLPVVTVLMGDGFVVDKKGRRETIVLRRKEVLVDYEPYSEEKAQKKRALKAARRKAAEERYRRGDAPPDGPIRPSGTMEERKALEEKGIEGGKAPEAKPPEASGGGARGASG